MKKVFLMAYARKNLGDDIFIKMLLEKYPQIDFYMKIENEEFLNELSKYNNLKILIGKDTDEELYKMDVEEYDAYVYIGGSIFMEGGQVYNLSEKFLDFVRRCKDKNIPFCYISCNYGPYQTREYFELENKIPNSIGISVINLDIRHDLKHIGQDYHDFLVNNINHYIEEGNKVYLYSFCKHEQDEVVMEKLMKEFENNRDVIEVRYDGNIDKFLETYSKMEYMICSRFHAMILSSICNQKIFVMSYSKKIDNVIEDLGLDLPILHFHKTDKNMIIDKEKFRQIDENRLLNIIEESENQDMVFKKKSQK